MDRRRRRGSAHAGRGCGRHGIVRVTSCAASARSASAEDGRRWRDEDQAHFIHRTLELFSRNGERRGLRLCAVLNSRAGPVPVHACTGNGRARACPPTCAAALSWARRARATHPRTRPWARARESWRAARARPGLAATRKADSTSTTPLPLSRWVSATARGVRPSPSLSTSASEAPGAAHTSLAARGQPAAAAACSAVSPAASASSSAATTRAWQCNAVLPGQPSPQRHCASAAGSLRTRRSSPTLAAGGRCAPPSAAATEQRMAGTRRRALS